jgi:hypothetical protein
MSYYILFLIPLYIYRHSVTWWMTIGKVLIGNRIYCTLKSTTRDYILQITIIQTLVFSVTVFATLPGNVFQQWTFLFSRPHVLAGWRLSHTNVLLFKLLSQDCPVMAACFRCISSTRTAQKIFLPKVLLLFLVCLLRRSGDGYWAIAYQRAWL